MELGDQIENRAPGDQLRETIAALKQCQVNLKEMEILEKQKEQQEKRRKSSQQLEAQLAQYRKQRLLNDQSVPRPATSPPRSATFLPQRATFVPPSPASPPRSATPPPRSATFVPQSPASPPQTATPTSPSRNLPDEPMVSIPSALPWLAPLRVPHRLTERPIFPSRTFLPSPVVPPVTCVKRGANESVERDRTLARPLSNSNESDNDSNEDDFSDGNCLRMNCQLNDGITKRVKKLVSRKNVELTANANSTNETDNTVTTYVISDSDTSVSDHVVKRPKKTLKARSSDKTDSDNCDNSDESAASDSEQVERENPKKIRKAAIKSMERLINETNSNIGKHNENSDNSDASESEGVETKRAKKPKARNTKAKTKAKAKTSGPKYFTETKLFTCDLCGQIFNSIKGFNIHKTRKHKEIIATEAAPATTKRRKAPEKKKTTPNQRNVNLNITVNNIANYNMLSRHW